MIIGGIGCRFPGKMLLWSLMSVSRHRLQRVAHRLGGELYGARDTYLFELYFGSVESRVVFRKKAGEVWAWTSQVKK